MTDTNAELVDASTDVELSPKARELTLGWLFSNSFSLFENMILEASDKNFLEITRSFETLHRSLEREKCVSASFEVRGFLNFIGAAFFKRACPKLDDKAAIAQLCGERPSFSDYGVMLELAEETMLANVLPDLSLNIKRFDEHAHVHRDVLYGVVVLFTLVDCRTTRYWPQAQRAKIAEEIQRLLEIVKTAWSTLGSVKEEAWLPVDNKLFLQTVARAAFAALQRLHRGEPDVPGEGDGSLEGMYSVLLSYRTLAEEMEVLPAWMDALCKFPEFVDFITDVINDSNEDCTTYMCAISASGIDELVSTIERQESIGERAEKLVAALEQGRDAVLDDQPHSEGEIYTAAICEIALGKFSTAFAKASLGIAKRSGLQSYNWFVRLVSLELRYVKNPRAIFAALTDNAGTAPMLFEMFERLPLHCMQKTAAQVRRWVLNILADVRENSDSQALLARAIYLSLFEVHERDYTRIAELRKQFGEQMEPALCGALNVWEQQVRQAFEAAKA